MIKRTLSLLLIVTAGYCTASSGSSVMPIDIMIAGETPVKGISDAKTRYEQFRDPGMITTITGRIVILAQARDHSKWSDRSGQDLAVRHSEDGGKTWPHQRILLPETTVAYVSLCSLKDGSIGLAYETEVYHGGSYKHIRLVKFRLNDILGHKDNLTGGTDPNARTYENK